MATATAYKPAFKGAAAPFGSKAKSSGGKGRLTAKSRKALKAKAFALPGRRFPINDANHARAALSMAHNVDRAKQQVIKRAVKRKYPGISVNMANEIAHDVVLGKDGSKWRHGYIPLNAIAVAMKNHKYSSDDKASKPKISKSRFNVKSEPSGPGRDKAPTTKIGRARRDTANANDTSYRNHLRAMDGADLADERKKRSREVAEAQHALDQADTLITHGNVREHRIAKGRHEMAVRRHAQVKAEISRRQNRPEIKADEARRAGDHADGKPALGLKGHTDADIKRLHAHDVANGNDPSRMAAELQARGYVQGKSGKWSKVTGGSTIATTGHDGKPVIIAQTRHIDISDGGRTAMRAEAKDSGAKARDKLTARENSYTDITQGQTLPGSLNEGDRVRFNTADGENRGGQVWSKSQDGRTVHVISHNEKTGKNEIHSLSPESRSKGRLGAGILHDTAADKQAAENFRGGSITYGRPDPGRAGITGSIAEHFQRAEAASAAKRLAAQTREAQKPQYVSKSEVAGRHDENMASFAKSGLTEDQANRYPQATFLMNKHGVRIGDTVTHPSFPGDHTVTRPARGGDVTIRSDKNTTVDVHPGELKVKRHKS